MRIVSRFVGALCLLLIASVAHAQDQTDPSQYSPDNWFKKACPTCGVHGYVDYPESGATLARAGSVIAGWGFECVSGRPVDRVELWYETSDGSRFLPLKQADYALIAGTIGRPDVRTAFAPYCPNTSERGGMVVTGDEPAAGWRAARADQVVVRPVSRGSDAHVQLRRLNSCACVGRAVGVICPAIYAARPTRSGVPADHRQRETRR
jgi:hypothetical protein